MEVFEPPPVKNTFIHFDDDAPQPERVQGFRESPASGKVWAFRGLVVRVWGLVFGVQGLGFGAWGLGFRCLACGSGMEGFVACACKRWGFFRFEATPAAAASRLSELEPTPKYNTTSTTRIIWKRMRARGQGFRRGTGSSYSRNEHET